MIETKFKSSIPEGWEVKKIGEVATICGGGTPSTNVANYWGGKINWFTPAEISEESGYVFSSERKITEEGLKNSSAKLLPKGSVLLTTRATIGNRAIAGCEVCTNQGFQSLIPKDIYNIFLYYNIATIVQDMRTEASGSTFLEISGKKLSEIQFIVPPSTEQTRIATALSDIDDLIATTRKLTEKKRNIKKGAMQELLSGKRRLPGFNEEWKEVSFKEIYKYASEGGTPDTSKAEYYNMGNLPFVKIEDTANKYIDSASSYITQEGLCNSSAWLIPSNNIIFTNGATVGNVAINRIAVTTKQGILGVLLKDDYDLEFIYYMLSFSPFQNEVHNRESGGTFATIILKNIDTIPLFIPNSKDEQAAISHILSDMDSEIQSLEARLTKYQNLKQGMMQQLLTGKIRLI